MSNIFKFGGASIKNAKAIENLRKIVFSNQKNLSLVVVSAMGKTTNKLEAIYNKYISGNVESAIGDSNLCIEKHLSLIDDLSLTENESFLNHFNSLCNELVSFLKTNKNKNTNFCYSKIVSFGELWSTVIISHYLNIQGLKNKWMDARELIQTESTYVESKVNWELTEKIIQEKLLNNHLLFISQGFIGANYEGETTTLGREGSDFSAAIYAHCLNIKNVVVWKDVDGLLNADPKWFKKTEIIENISYKEALELSYLGASVIHPKTIKPLQNKNIKLYIRSFKNPKKKGTLVNENVMNDGKIPSIIYHPNQILISISTKDYSYVFEEHISEFFAIFSKFGFKVHLMQNSALNFSVCGITSTNSIHDLINLLQKKFTVKYNKKVDLLTLRHYKTGFIPDFLNSKEILIQQSSRNTVRYILKN